MTILVIASASRANLSAQENMLRHVKAFKKANKLALAVPSEATGFFQEEQMSEPSMEQSWVFPIKDSDLGRVHKLFCETYEQDSILLINPETQECGILEKDLQEFGLGKFQSVESHEAETLQAWTFFKGKYWTAK